MSVTRHRHPSVIPDVAVAVGVGHVGAVEVKG